MPQTFEDEYASFLDSMSQDGGTKTRGWSFSRAQFNEVTTSGELRSSRWGRMKPGDAAYERSPDSIKFNNFTGLAVVRHQIAGKYNDGIDYGMVGYFKRKNVYKRGDPFTVRGELGNTYTMYKTEKEVKYEGEGTNIYDVGNFYESGSRNIRAGIYDPSLKMFREDKIYERFDNNPELVKAYHDLYNAAAAYKKSGGRSTKLDFVVKTDADGGQYVEYTLRGEAGKVKKTVKAKISSDNLDAVSKMDLAQYVIDNGGFGTGGGSKEVFYKLLSNVNINKDQIDSVMRLGFLSNDLSTADRSGIILNRMVTI